MVTNLFTMPAIPSFLPLHSKIHTCSFYKEKVMQNMMLTLYDTTMTKCRSSMDIDSNMSIKQKLGTFILQVKPNSFAWNVDYEVLEKSIREAFTALPALQATLIKGQ